MARTLKDAKLDTRSARHSLKRRREPHWRSISPGLAIGYRKLATGGTWIARHYSPGTGRRYKALGTADDVADADGEHILSFAEAQSTARDWFASLARRDRNETTAGPYAVAAALDDYLADYDRRGGKAKARMVWTVNAHIRTELGAISVEQLSRRRIEGWHAKMAEAPRRLRTKRGKRQKYREEDKSPEAVRGRRSTANRILTILKAALNLANHNRRADHPERWQAVKPFREVDAPAVRYLSDAAAKRLVNGAAADFRRMVVAAMLSGARYGELAALKAGNYNPDSGTIFIARSKGGKIRHVHLTEEGQRFFAAAAAGKEAGDLLLPRADGGMWGNAHQARPIRDACKHAKIAPPIGFHVLRHTYASRLAMRGVPLQVIAQQLGHGDTRMV
jgi:integrase